MRILVATDQWFPDVAGGVARVATDTASRLAAAGHEVTVIAPRAPGWSHQVWQDGSLTVMRVLSRSGMPQTFSDVFGTRRYARQLRARRFDVAVAHTNTTACGLLRARLGAPLVYVFHSDTARELSYLSSIHTARRERLVAAALARPLRRYESEALDGAAAIVVLSRFSCDLLHEISPTATRRAFLIGGAVDTDVFHPERREHARATLGIGPEERLVFTVRRLVPRMGLENLVEAAALLGDVDGLRVVIGGTGELRERLERTRSRLGLDERVALVGHVADEALPLWFRAADLFVLPTAAYEGFGLVTAEALASGTPAVGTPIGATPELLETLDPRLVARGTDPPALADAIRTGLTLATPELRRACRTQALARHAWSAVMPAWERLLSEAASGALEWPSLSRRTWRRRSIEAGAVAIRLSGAPRAARRRGAAPRAGILVYHDPTTETVRRHLAVLGKRHAFVSLGTIVDALTSGDWSEIPSGALAVTLDDGWRANAALREVFAEHGVVPTVFLCSGIVGTHQPFWWTLPRLAVDALKRVPDRERLTVLATHPAHSGCPQALSREQVRELVGSVAFGAHSISHPVLTRCTDAEAERQIVESKRQVESLTEQPCSDFAFPNGSYGERELELVRRAGFRSARTTIPGWVTPEADRFQLPIVPMPDNASASRASSQLALVTFAPSVLAGSVP